MILMKENIRMECASVEMTTRIREVDSANPALTISHPEKSHRKYIATVKVI